MEAIIARWIAGAWAIASNPFVQIGLLGLSCYLFWLAGKAAAAAEHQAAERTIAHAEDIADRVAKQVAATLSKYEERFTALESYHSADCRVRMAEQGVDQARSRYKATEQRLSRCLKLGEGDQAEELSRILEVGSGMPTVPGLPFERISPSASDVMSTSAPGAESIANERLRYLYKEWHFFRNRFERTIEGELNKLRINRDKARNVLHSTQR